MADTLLSDALITDTGNASHRARNVRLFPAEDLQSTTQGHPRYGMILPGAAARATFCAAPYGRGNGWEGRSASALREGCLPLLVQPPGATMALEPFVPWERFSVRWSDAHLVRDGADWARRLRDALAARSPAQLDAMRCEMACAATHMSWEAPSCPPASCAEAVRADVRTRRTGVLATLLTILDNRRRPPHERRVANVCPCEEESTRWHYMHG